FWPEATADAATVAMLVELDPVGLVRGSSRRANRPGGGDGLLDHYVNDRPYALSSFASVALGRAFGTPMNGACAERPELSGARRPLTVQLTALPCRGGAEIVARLFEPLGYRVEAGALALDDRHPSWGASRYLDVVLVGEQRVVDLLSHLYVLVPV